MLSDQPLNTALHTQTEKVFGLNCPVQKNSTEHMYSTETVNTKSLPLAFNPESEVLEVLLQGHQC